jgi:(p)ppGpp synthase/HD superfamily hydrolase
MKTVMLTATQARAKARNDLVIFNEIRNLEESIISATGGGLLEVAVDTTTMTTTSEDGIASSRLYSKTWQGIIDDRAREQQMASVIEYFSNLGYQIDRRMNPVTGDTFKWHIFW